jgi:hypothetical protein
MTGGGKAAVLTGLALIATGAASAAVADGRSGSIVLRGVSQPTVVATPSAGATTVDITANLPISPTTTAPAGVGASAPSPVVPTPTETTIPAGSIVVKANALNGFVMKVTTSNGAAAGASTGIMMSRQPGNNDVIVYTLNLSGQSVPFSAGVATGMDRNGPTPPGGITVPLSVTVHLSPYLQAGTYTDVLSFDIKGK